MQEKEEKDWTLGLLSFGNILATETPFYTL